MTASGRSRSTIACNNAVRRCFHASSILLPAESTRTLKYLSTARQGGNLDEFSHAGVQAPYRLAAGYERHRKPGCFHCTCQRRRALLVPNAEQVLDVEQNTRALGPRQVGAQLGRAGGGGVGHGSPKICREEG